MLSHVRPGRAVARRGTRGFASIVVSVAALSTPVVIAGGCGDGRPDPIAKAERSTSAPAGGDHGADRPANASEPDADRDDPAVPGSASDSSGAAGSSTTLVGRSDAGGAATGSSRHPSTDASSATSSTTATSATGGRASSPTTSTTTTTTATGPTAATRPAPRTGPGGCAGVEAVLAASVTERAAASASGDQRRYWSDDPDALKATLFAEPPFGGWTARGDGGCKGPSGQSGFCADSYDDGLALNERRLDVLYSRGWNDEGSFSTGDGLIVQTVYEFETTKGAAGYLEDAARHLCGRPDVVETFEVPGVQGAIGFTLAKEYDSSPLTDIVLYSKGPRMYRLFWMTGQLTDHRAMVDLVNRAAARST